MPLPGHRRRSGRSPDAKRCRLLRETPARVGACTSAEGAFAEVSGEVHGEEAFCNAYVTAIILYWRGRDAEADMF